MAGDIALAGVEIRQPDHSCCVDHKRDPFERLVTLVTHPESAEQLPTLVGEQPTQFQTVLGCKVCVSVGGVRGDAEDLGVRLAEPGVVLGKGKRLVGSSTGVCLGVKEQHQVLLALVITAADLPPIMSRQHKGRGLVPRF